MALSWNVYVGLVIEAFREKKILAIGFTFMCNV